MLISLHLMTGPALSRRSLRPFTAPSLLTTRSNNLMVFDPAASAEDLLPDLSLPLSYLTPHNVLLNRQLHPLSYLLLIIGASSVLIMIIALG